MYLREKKLELAADLLKSNNLFIKEIAGRLNYPSPQYFSTAFKKYFGISPKYFE